MRLVCVLLACLAAEPAWAVEPVGLGDVRWTAGFWAERFAVCRDATVPAMGRLMAGTERSQFLHNFRVAAGLADGSHRGPSWNDGDFYKWLEAAAAVYSVTKDRDLDRQMDDAIAVLAKAQRADGYLHTPVLIRQRNGDAAAKPFEDRLAFEMYNLGHLFTAGCVHHRATGKRSLLALATRAADFLIDAFRDPPAELTRHAVCPAHYMGLVELYRTTGEKKYLALAVRLLDLRDKAVGGGDDNQDRVPFRKQTEAVGHAVRANYLYAGAADVVAATGDRTLLGPLETIWANVVGRKLYVTGACGALYDGASPDGSRDQKQITRTHQAYGRDYQLPNAAAHNETCAAIGNVLWNERMLRVTGEAKYADVLERSLYNAVLAGVSLDGRRFFYTNTLRQLDDGPELRWSRRREEWISCYCCPPNVARMVAQVHTLAYGRSDGALWVHLYGGGTVATRVPGVGEVKLTQTTDYPWDGRVKLTLDAVPDAAFALRPRVPAWAAGATLTVNGQRWDGEVTPGRYAEVRRTWKPGDVVELTLPMPVRLVQAHPLVEEARGQVAVRRGPLVYCLESTDLERGTRLLDVALPRGVALKPRFDGDLLGGVTVLEGTAERGVEPAWGGELYRDLPPAAAKPTPVRLVPYYAWGNRGQSEMSVWLPLAR